MNNSITLKILIEKLGSVVHLSYIDLHKIYGTILLIMENAWVRMVLLVGIYRDATALLKKIEKIVYQTFVVNMRLGQDCTKAPFLEEAIKAWIPNFDGI